MVVRWPTSPCLPEDGRIVENGVSSLTPPHPLSTFLPARPAPSPEKHTFSMPMHKANASALSLPSTAVQWGVISALMGKAVVGGGGRGFVLEALAFVVNRGLGLLGRYDCRGMIVTVTLPRFYLAAGPSTKGYWMV